MKFIYPNDSYELLIRPGQKVIPKKMIETMESCEAILQTAKEKASKIEKNAQESAKKLKEKKSQEGFEEGLSKVSSLLLELEERISKVRFDIQKVALPIALKAAQKIVGEELRLHPEKIVDLVIQAIQPLTQCKTIKILVHPDDLAYLEKQKPRIKEVLKLSEVIQIEASHELEVGNAVIESESGIINATLPHLFASLESLFESFMRYG